MAIDWNVKFADLLALCTLIGSLFYFTFRVGSLATTIEIMEKEIEDLKESYKLIASAMTTIAVQKSQLERVEKDIQDLRRGKGFIANDRRTGVDGEY